MSGYPYERLDLARDAIRLVRLYKGYFLEEIRCELWEVFLSELEGVPYEALSYTWGSPDKPEPISINGFTAHVTRNLEEALRYLRLEDEDRVIWIDAICINQDDDEERGHQVGQMRQIYEKAERVLIWLGQSGAETHLLMHTMNQLSRRVRKTTPEESRILRGYLEGAPTEWCAQQKRALEDMLQRPWFRRIWILQEVASARRATVYCGVFSVPADIFALMPSLIGVQPDEHCQAVLDIMPGISRQHSWWSSRRDLATLLAKLGNTSRASDKRDHVYALLGIASDTSAGDKLKPHYYKDVEEVFRDAAFFLIFRAAPDPSVHQFPPISLQDLASGPSHLASLIFEWTLRHMTISPSLGEELCERLVAEKLVDLNHVNDEGLAPLQTAARFGNIGAIQFLLNYPSVDVNAVRTASAHGSPLWLAASNRRFKAVELLLGHPDIDVNLSGPQGIPPVAIAANCGDEAIVSLLLKHGAEPDFSSASISWLAAMDSPLCEFMLEHGANPDYQGPAGLNPLDRPWQYKTLIGGVEVELSNDKSPLMLAARIGRVRSTKLLLEKGATVNAEDSQGRTALAHAAATGELDAMDVLLQYGADPEHRDERGMTILMATAKTGFDRVAEKLVKGGAMVDARGPQGRTALSLAAQEGSVDVVAALLRAGAEVDSRDDDDRAPLWWAGSDHRGEAVKSLLQHGAETPNRSSSKKTFLGNLKKWWRSSPRRARWVR